VCKVVDKTMFRNAENADNSAVCLNASGLCPSECHFILNVNVPFFLFSVILRTSTRPPVRKVHQLTHAFV
jgi:hypothetical protein